MRRQVTRQHGRTMTRSLKSGHANATGHFGGHAVGIPQQAHYEGGLIQVSQTISSTLPAADTVDRWDSYWEKLNSESWLYREQSELYVEKLASAVPLHAGMHILDFGCGFGFTAEFLVDHVADVWIWDSSANMRRRALERLAGRDNCHLLDLSNAGGAVDGPFFDLILVNSVVQYMSTKEFAGWLTDWRRRLAPNGRVLVSDLIPPDLGSVPDVLDLLRLGRRKGLLWRALRQCAAGAFSYSSRRNAAPLARYSREDLNRLGNEACMHVHILDENLTQFSRRTTVCFSANL
jgi:SAM-dependent methyltransferase